MPDSPRENLKSPFPTTSWSLVQRVQKGTEEDALKAMGEICQIYWYPIYVYVRRHGFSQHDAEDLVQFFFEQMIARETIQAAKEEKGRLRTFMLRLLKQVISRQVRHDVADKRGGGQSVLSLDEMDAEGRYVHEPQTSADPGLLFDRVWAKGVLERAEAKLRDDFAEADNLATFEAIRHFLPSGDAGRSYAEVAAVLGIRDAAVRLHVHRMRKRFAVLIEEEIAQTVGSPAELDAERDYLIGLVGGD